MSTEVGTFEMIAYGFAGFVLVTLAVMIVIAVVHVVRHGMPKSGGEGDAGAPPLGQIDPSNVDAGGGD